jgi:hypothetical protein
LYTGWARLDELAELEQTWHICEAVSQETEFVREYDAAGSKRTVPVDLSSVLKNGILHPVKPESDAEYVDYANYAVEIDDGEAQAIAIAKHRNFVLLSDDRLALKFASQPEVGVRTITTPQILKIWADLSSANEARLYDIVPRIVELAKYSPKIGSPLSEWWSKYCGART